MSNTSVVDQMISNSSVPAVPVLKNMNATLSDIYVRYVALKKEDCQLYYKVYTEVFRRLHELMKQVDPYYARYSSAIKFAGSHYDRLRISKPSEYDLVIGINVPVNMNAIGGGGTSDILIEPVHPGYVQLRGGVQYQRLLVRDGADCMINRTAHSWMDDRNYIRRSNFANWFKGVVTKALKQLPRYSNRASLHIDGVLYTIRHTEGGPAFTLIIENLSGFKLDVDLVPALIFPESRWPVEGYRAIPPGCHTNTWIVVPKPNKYGHTVQDGNRSWRIGLQEQERKMIYNSHNLRLTIKLLKKLRDSRDMTKIASYYIKTLFLWEIEERNDPSFWSRNDLATLFKYMVQKFYNALREGRISYFWNRRYNLIGNVNRQILDGYANIVEKLLRDMNEMNGHQKVAKQLLTDKEYQAVIKCQSTSIIYGFTAVIACGILSILITIAVMFNAILIFDAKRNHCYSIHLRELITEQKSSNLETA